VSIRTKLPGVFGVIVALMLVVGLFAVVGCASRIVTWTVGRSASRWTPDDRSETAVMALAVCIMPVASVPRGAAQGGLCFGHPRLGSRRSGVRRGYRLAADQSIGRGMPADDPLLDVNRLAVLRDLAILDTPAEPAYDDLARLASACCQSGIAAVNFVDDERHWTKAIVGVDGGQGASVLENVSLCAATVRTDSGLLTIPDMLASERWRSHPFVTAGPELRFYAGAAIIVSDEPIGVVCVFGDQPREFGEEAEQALVALARQTSAQLQLRQHNARLRDLAATDSLTGLGNRRALNADLVSAVKQLTAERTATLALFDLDGFKQYNDTYGHPAGDALLARMGAKLAESVSDHGRAYRLGGDEFCVLIPRGESSARAVIDLAAVALTEIGDGFTVQSSYGVVQMPAEACDGDAALQLADQRLYVRKGMGRASAKRQSRDVLMQALREHTPQLGDHTQGVRELAEAVTRRLMLRPGFDDIEVEVEVERVGNTADLHDIGKMAIPRDILDKPGPLTDEEWVFMRRHTIIGERIICAAPALGDVAAAVRATHERWDGTGYPDAIAGADIPLAVRIVAVCDAFDAMTAERPYTASRGTTDAVIELKRCAGSQFDPTVVTAFEQVFTDRFVSPLISRPADAPQRQRRPTSSRRDPQVPSASG